MEDIKCSKCKNLLPFTTSNESITCSFCGCENEQVIAKPHSWPRSIGSRNNSDATESGLLVTKNDCSDSGSDGDC
jgi:LSD1 subclass zinc finger protein